MFLEMLESASITSKFSEKLYLILANISYSGKNKAKFLANGKLAPLILTTLSSEKFKLKHKAICSQFMINLMYKSGAAITLFNREEVKEELRFILKESERAIDKLNFIEENLRSDEDLENLRNHKIIVENLGSSLNVLSSDWGATQI